MSDSVRCFISYSWDDDDHIEWVKNLAGKLRNDGITTILDKWHAVPGDQLPEFMEREIRESDFVLIICSPNYKLKSDSRTGGVGYEGDIITSEIFIKKERQKFIPILKLGHWQESAPTYLLGKYYINLANEDHYTSNYENLLATLLGKREKAPPVGKPPANIKEPSGIQKFISFSSLRDFLFHKTKYFLTPNGKVSAISFFHILKDLFNRTTEVELVRFGGLMYESIENFFIYGDFNEATKYLLMQLPEKIEHLINILNTKVNNCDDITVHNDWIPWFPLLREFKEYFEHFFSNYTENFQEAEILNTKWRCDTFMPCIGDDWKRDYWENKMPRLAADHCIITFKSGGIDGFNGLDSSWQLQNGILTIGYLSSPNSGWYYGNMSPPTLNRIHLFYFFDPKKRIPSTISRLSRIWE